MDYKGKNGPKRVVLGSVGISWDALNSSVEIFKHVNESRSNVEFDRKQ